jgi:peptide-methionine (S)-S-oxide reductase
MSHRVPMLAVAALVTGALAGALVLGMSRQAATASESPIVAPAPIIDEPLSSARVLETAILSGGCFWGMQDVFQHVRGVRAVISGYTGGERGTAHYQDVSTGTTGHAESIEIIFNPRLITYGALLRIYFSVATNPTELDFQGPDHGPQYRGVIWTLSREQSRIAQAYRAQLEHAHLFRAPIVTRIESARPFYRAESYHQNFATRHPDNLYIMTFDAPKVAALARLFPAAYLSRPTLATGATAPGAPAWHPSP